MALVRAGVLFSAVFLALTGCASAASSDPPPRHACPHTDRARLANHGSGLKTWLVPPGPTAIELCRYRGLIGPGRRGTLAVSRRIAGGGTVAFLANALNALPPVPKGTFNCPSGDGSKVLAIFLYPHRSAVTVRIDLDGCPTATNGGVVRWGETDAGVSLVQRLEGLTRR